MKARRLSQRQRLFADAYAKHGNAETAAIEAGYSKTTARNQAEDQSANAGKCWHPGC